MCTYHHLGNWYRHFLELREKGRFMNYIFFRKRPCRMLLKLLAGLREVFSRPLLHGKSIPPTLWTKLILRKLYSKNESAADRLIHFNIFYNACPTTMVKRGKLGHCSGREQCLTGQKRTTCHQSVFSLYFFGGWGGSLFFLFLLPLSSEVSMSSNRPSQMC